MLIDEDSRFSIKDRMAPRFVFDREAVSTLQDTFEDFDVTGYGRWAKPPFDRMYMEFEFGSGPIHLPIGMVVYGGVEKPGGSITMFSREQYDKGKVLIAPLGLVWDDKDFDIIALRKSAIDTLENDPFIGDAVKEFLYIGFCAILMLNRPAAVRLNSTPRTAKLVKGKRVVYQAYSTVKIDLGEAKQYVRTFETGTHGSPRRHKVRGYWVNWHRNSRCDHDWQARPHPRDLESYECMSCGQIRTWKPSFERGDASKGYVTHEYQVTDSRR